jgi:hypothetical protein
VGNYGDAPWGNISQGKDDAVGPQSAGIPGVVRIIYMLNSEPIEVRDLGTDRRYVATYFDPVTGHKTKTPAVVPRANGSWICQPPPRNHHDWVVILETEQEPGQGSKTVE